MKKIYAIGIVFSLTMPLVFPFALPAHAASWYNASWTYRVKITVDHTKVGSTLTNYPVYVDLSNLPSGFFTHVKSDGSDIRVTETNGTTEVSREIVGISTSGSTGEMHFLAPSLSSSADTDFYIYYGNASATEPAASATYGSQNVWDSNFAAVWHLASGGSASGSDSTSNAQNGTLKSSPPAVAGVVGQAISLNGSNGYVSMGVPSGSLNLTHTGSISIVFKTTKSGLQQLMGNYYNNGDDRGYGFLMNYPSSGNILLEIANSSTYSDLHTSASYRDGAWHSVTGTWDGTTQRIFVDGALVASQAQTIDPVSNVHAFNIGYDTTSGDYRFNGSVDEARVSSFARSADWVSTAYKNQNSPSTFYTPGSEETNSALDTTPPTPNPATFSSAPAGAGTSSVSMTATTASDAGGSTPIEYNFTLDNSTCGADAGSGGTSSGWQTSTSYTDTGLGVNRCYGYSVQSRDSLGNTGTASSIYTAYALANVPSAPTLSGATPTTFTVINNANGNPNASPSTLFAAYVTSTDSTWNNKYINGAGNPSSSAAWISNAALTGLVATGLAPSTSYTVTVKAENQDSVATSFGTGSAISTTAAGAGYGTRIIRLLGIRLRGVRLR